MWLQPVFAPLSRLTARMFYRITLPDARIPRDGPVLVVANHPNSLFDPVVVAAAARRPVRFLAKAPLFGDPKVGWIIRGSGAIPVYRRKDDPTAMDRNEDMFRAVFDVLAGGDCVALFPEGISHDNPALAELKTGAARIALGAAERTAASFPIIPVGLVFRRKEIFRSQAFAAIGEPVSWNDLATRGLDDRDAVRQLTGRIEAGLRKVTLNLDTWEDRPLVSAAESVWAAEFGEPRDHASRLERTAVITRILQTYRTANDDEVEALIQLLRNHRERLRRLRLTPGDLHADRSARTATTWTLKRLPLLGLPALAIAVLGALLFWIPYQLTGAVTERFKPDRDQISTTKLLVGLAIYLIWTVALSATAALLLSPLAGVVTLLLVPLIGRLGLRVREVWRDSLRGAFKYFAVLDRHRFVEKLAARQRHLAERMEAVYRRWLAERSPAPPTDKADRVDG